MAKKKAPSPVPKRARVLANAATKKPAKKVAAKSSGSATLAQIMAELKALGSATTKATLMRHGAREPFFGVKVGDMKKLVKRIDHDLALSLYDTGNSDAMYLAALAIDAERVTKADLEKWVQKAYWYMLSCYAVAWVAAESPHGWELARKWIDSKEEMTSSAGWSTLSSWVMLRPDEELDLAALKKLLARVEKEIGKAANRTKAAMNSFLMAAGQCVRPMYDTAIATADKIGKVEVDVGDTSCKTPNAAEYLRAMATKGKLGYKKKQARC